MPRLVLLAVLMGAAFSPVLPAQTTPSINYNSIRTPEIRLGSGTQPTMTNVPPATAIPSVPDEPRVSNAIPASTELLATRHFDFIVSPSTEFPWPRGTMADTSISLGEYARQLRAQKPHATDQSLPNAIAEPTDSR